MRLLVAALAFCACLTAAPAQSVPNWNVTYPANPGHATQRIHLTATDVTISTRFPQNKAVIVIPLALIKSISAPYKAGGAWAIDFALSKKITFKSYLDIGPVDVVSTDDTSMSLLTQADAAAARTYVLGKLGR